MAKGRQRQKNNQQKHKTKGIFAGLLVLLVSPGPSRLFWSSHPPKIPSFSGTPGLHDNYLYILSGVGSKKGEQEGCRWRGKSHCRCRCVCFFFLLGGKRGREIYLLLEEARCSFYLVDSFPLSPLFIMANISALDSNSLRRPKHIRRKRRLQMERPVRLS